MVFTVTHQIVKSKQPGFTNSHLHKVEDKQKINPCTSFQSRSMFDFETEAIWTSEFSQCVTGSRNAISLFSNEETVVLTQT